MAVTRLDINNNPYLGVYCLCNEDIALVPPFIDDRRLAILEETLSVKGSRTTISGGTVLGSLGVMNCNGLVLSDPTTETPTLPANMKVGFSPTRFNALGNLVVANDSAALCSPLLGDEVVRVIAETLKVKVDVGTIAGLTTVGSCAVATSKGILCHPRVTEREVAVLEELFHLDVATSTANFGTPYIGACLLANSRGVLTGSPSTGIELGRIENGLGL